MFEATAASQIARNKGLESGCQPDVGVLLLVPSMIAGDWSSLFCDVTSVLDTNLWISRMLTLSFRIFLLWRGKYSDWSEKLRTIHEVTRKQHEKELSSRHFV